MASSSAITLRARPAFDKDGVRTVPSWPGRIAGCVRRRIGMLFSTALILLATVCSLAYLDFQQYMETRDRLELSHRVQHAATELLALVADLETAQRGYVITANEGFLAPYEAARNALPLALGALQRVTIGDDSQQQRLRRLEPLIAQQLAWAQEVIRLRRQWGFDAAADMTRTGIGVELGAGTRSVLDAMLDDERFALHERSVAAAAHAQGAARTIASASLIGFCLLFLTAWAAMRSERVLRRSDERFRLAAEALHGQIYDWDIATDTVHRTQGLMHIVGFRPEETEPRPRWWARRVHPEDLKRVCDAMREVRSNRAPAYSIEYRVRNKSEEYVWVWDQGCVVYDDQGRALRVVGTVLDITERKQIERLKSEIVSIASHELRTPLTSVMGALGLVRGGAIGELPPKAKSLCDIAYRNAERLVSLIGDLLSIDKIESGRMPFALQPVELLPLVQEALVANGPFAEQLGVTLALQPDTDRVTVQADPERLFQVLTNLLSNAAKFSPRGETVAVRLLRTEGAVRVEVIDHGPGIPDGFRSRIFEKFTQASPADPRAKAGTGLGLSISKAIIERLGGRIGFESSPGRGTTFYFELPEADSECQVDGTNGARVA